MNKKLDKKRNIDFYLLYTLVFFAVALALYLKFLQMGNHLSGAMTVCHSISTHWHIMESI